jgi:hypothetical protein
VPADFFAAFLGEVVEVGSRALDWKSAPDVDAAPDWESAPDVDPAPEWRWSPE